MPRADLTENGIDDVLDVALVKVRFLVSDACEEADEGMASVDEGSYDVKHSPIDLGGEPD